MTLEPPEVATPAISPGRQLTTTADLVGVDTAGMTLKRSSEGRAPAQLCPLGPLSRRD